MQASDPNRPTANNWRERVAFGFVAGLLTGFFTGLYASDWQDALTGGLVFGCILAGISFFCTKRGFERLIDFVGYFR